jgi:alkanesulfonate monooxygenase SsuD/methylene tetrahydromethanopterin reductase-like flavin-dependent oxidoreductase (luciferase family)
MDFSTMVLTMYIASEDGPQTDERVLAIAIEQSLIAAGLGYNPWYTEHHFRGPWHSNPMQFASYIAPQIPSERFLGFGVLSAPYYNPVRLVESMNLLDQLTKGHTLYGLGSGFAGTEPLGLGVEKEYHGSGQAARDTVDVMQHLWEFKTGDPEYHFDIPTHEGTVRRRVAPAAYRKLHPTIIRTARLDPALINAAQKGWPVFLGTTFGGESPLLDQVRIYRKALAEANHPPEIIAECLRWCTCDWLSVVVADTDAEAEANAEKARAEALTVRQRFVERFGPMEGPVAQRKAGESTAEAYAKGGDMMRTIAGNPDTVAKRVQRLVDLGINHLLVRFLGEWTGETRAISENSMRLFAREVLPRFKDVAPLSDPLALDLSAVS